MGGVGSSSRLSIIGATGSYASGIGFTGTGTGASTYRTYINTAGALLIDDNTRGSTRLILEPDGDLAIDTVASGLILKSADGTRYKITVANNGTVTSTAV